MSVYVDDMEAPFGRMKMCHMIADTHGELVRMADHIGVARKWIQYPGRHDEHFDICKSVRALAVTAGAVEIGLRELAAKTHDRRGDGERRYFDGWGLVGPPGGRWEPPQLGLDL